MNEYTMQENRQGKEPKMYLIGTAIRRITVHSEFGFEYIEPGETVKIKETASGKFQLVAPCGRRSSYWTFDQLIARVQPA